MKCAELMKTEIECCRVEEPVDRVAERMLSRNVGFIPVCDDENIVVGTLTDRDLALRVLAEHRPFDTAAQAVMTHEVVCCRPEDELSVAEELMSKHKKSRIICTDEHGRAVGIISLSDVVQAERNGRASALLRSVAQRESRL